MMGYFDVIIKIHEPYYHHVFLLDNLALTCKCLIYRCNLSRRNLKVTNQKQKFHLFENENIELRFVNVENKGKFPILIFVQLYKVIT